MICHTAQEHKSTNPIARRFTGPLRLPEGRTVEVLATIEVPMKVDVLAILNVDTLSGFSTRYQRLSCKVLDGLVRMQVLVL
jgi:hypothetical protein